MPTLTLDGRAVAYRLTRHPRARRVRMVIEPEGLRVSAPPRMPARLVHDAVLAQEEWLRRHAHRLHPPPVPELRDGSLLPLLGGVVELGVRAGARDAVAFRPDDGRLAITASTPEMARSLVERWYRAQARRWFEERAADHATRMGTAFTALRVGDPRSRWGSCSTAGTLSFSWRLMLAPARVAEYVAVHEVAHLREMNHSPRFWALVQEAWPGHRDDVRWLGRHGHDLRRGPAPVSPVLVT